MTFLLLCILYSILDLEKVLIFPADKNCLFFSMQVIQNLGMLKQINKKQKNHTFLFRAKDPNFLNIKALFLLELLACFKMLPT